jgi:hypothetical protein
MHSPVLHGSPVHVLGWVAGVARVDYGEVAVDLRQLQCEVARQVIQSGMVAKLTTHVVGLLV